jgi:hypothetical protein
MLGIYFSLLWYFATLQNTGFGSNLREKKQKLLSNISSALHSTMKQFKVSQIFLDMFIYVTFDILAGPERKEGKQIVDNHNNCLL